jgi:hypothetical protein
MLSVTVEQNNFIDFDLNDGKWRLRIKSDPEIALRDFESTRYWKGDITAPLQVTDTSEWEAPKASRVEKDP